MRKTSLLLSLLLPLSAFSLTLLDEYNDRGANPGNILFANLRGSETPHLLIGLAQAFLLDDEVSLQVNWSAGSLLVNPAGEISSFGRSLGDVTYDQDNPRMLMLPLTAEQAATMAGDDQLKLFSLAGNGRLLDETTRTAERDPHLVAFVHHGNQGLTWSDVFYGTDPDGTNRHWAEYVNDNNPNNGFDEILGLHDSWDIPVNIHLASTLQTSADWYYSSTDGFEGFNEWLTRGAAEGWVGMISSAWAQHIMPFVNDNMNDWSVSTETDMIAWRYDYVPHCAWIPERVWVSPTDNDGWGPDASFAVEDWIGDDWLPHGIEAVILDQDVHCTYKNNAFEDRHIYTINTPNGDLKIIPMDNTFVGHVNWDPGLAWDDLIYSSPDELIVYGNDWEVAAEVAGFENLNPDYLNNYIWLLNNINGSGGAVEAVTLDAVRNDFGGGSISLINGTYFLLGGYYGYGADWIGGFPTNSWYPAWAGTIGHSDYHDPGWNYGTIWNQVYSNLMGAPANNVSETGWYVMMTNLHETGWHDGGEIAGWEHRYSSHIKNANVYAVASHWAAGEYAEATGAYLEDVDIDGVDELVLHNDRVFAVFESVGGKLQWLFAKGAEYNFSVVGNDNVYWTETDGDYNEDSGNHVAALSDVSPYQEHELYTLAVAFDDPTSAGVQLTHGAIVKTISVNAGDPWLDVTYQTGGQNVWFQNTSTPDLLAATWSADIERVWDPQAAYMGHRNPQTGATCATVLGNGGGNFNFEFSGTLLKGDEFFAGDGSRIFLWAGWSDTPDPNGEIPALELLAAQNMDIGSPRLLAQGVYLAPRQLLVRFNEAMDPVTTQLAANYQLSGLSVNPGVSGALLQGNQTEVVLTLDTPLPTGETGLVTVTAVEDLNGNLIDPAYNTASFQVASGLTPHTIVIDGLNDFDRANELIEVSSGDSLFITWDQTAFYIGYYAQSLAAADFFVNIDTDQAAGSGDIDGSWSRVNFADPHLVDYQVAVEGGGGSMQINHWSGSSWSYLQYWEHDGTSYEGWDSNGLTELSIPWSELGNPAGIAFSVHLTAEDSWLTTAAYPTTNPIGNNVTLTDVYQLYVPYVSGDMPLMGYRPAMMAEDAPPPVSDLVITISDGDLLLSWSAVPGAGWYNVYRSDTPYFDPEGWTPLAIVTTPGFAETQPDDTAFYVVTVGY